MVSRFCIELNVYTDNYGRKKDVSIANTHFLTPFLSLSLSLYTARLSFEYYRQVNFVNSGLQDEILQVTISKLP